MESKCFKKTPTYWKHSLLLITLYNGLNQDAVFISLQRKDHHNSTASLPLMNYQVLLCLWDKYISVMYALFSSQCIYIFFGVNFYLYAYTCNAHSGDCYFAISWSKSIWSTDTIYFPTAAFSSIIAGVASTAFTITVKVGHMAKMWGGLAFDQVDRECQVPAVSWNASSMTRIWCRFNADSDTGQFMVQFMSWLSYQGQASYKM